MGDRRARRRSEASVVRRSHQLWLFLHSVRPDCVGKPITYSTPRHPDPDAPQPVQEPDPSEMPSHAATRPAD
jgi:hypothetical protein